MYPAMSELMKPSIDIRLGFLHELEGPMSQGVVLLFFLAEEYAENARRLFNSIVKIREAVVLPDKMT